MTELGDAEIVIVGGGAIGCAIAYRLTEAGRRDVLLIEKEPALASVTTAQAAGLVGQVRSSIDRVRLAMDSVATFEALEEGPNPRPAWRRVGSLRIALEDARVEEFERLIRIARAASLEVELLDRAAAEARWPGLVTAPAKAILWCPSDGYLQPYDLAMAYRARAASARFATGVRLTGITLQADAVVGIETDRGKIRCQTVINAAGAHAYHIARMAGLELPIVPVRHEYFITVPTGGIRPDWPCLRVPDATLYGRPDVGALLLGGWEPAAFSLDPRSYAATGEPPAIEPDWPVLANFSDLFSPLYPAVREAGIRQRLPRLADLHARWPLHRRREPAGAGLRHGRRLQCARRLGIGRDRPPGGRGPARAQAYVRSLGPDRFIDAGFNWTEARRQAQAVYETYYGIGH
jgi:glycine/D-amino acid oxidase-like deaminating enzyme